jgi:hypothetical protein
MNALKEWLFAKLNLIRIVRLAMGIWILVVAIPERDWASGLFGSLFLITAIAGVGCCGATACYPAQNNKMKGDSGRINYEEIK